jgi:hypothetical protein
MRDDGRFQELPAVGMDQKLRRAFVQLPSKRADLTAGRNTEEFTFVTVFTQGPSLLTAVGLRSREKFRFKGLRKRPQASIMLPASWRPG